MFKNKCHILWLSWEIKKPQSRQIPRGICLVYYYQSYLKTGYVRQY